MSSAEIVKHNYNRAQIRLEGTWDNVWSSIAQPTDRKKISAELEILQQSIENVERAHQAIIDKERDVPWYLGKKTRFTLLGVSLLLSVVGAIANSVDLKVQNNANCNRPVWLLVVFWCVFASAAIYSAIQVTQSFIKNEEKKQYQKMIAAEKKQQEHIKKARDLLVKFISSDNSKLQEVYMRGIVQELRELPPTYSDKHPEIHDIIAYLVNLTPEGSDSRLLVSNLKNTHSRKRSHSLPPLLPPPKDEKAKPKMEPIVLAPSQPPKDDKEKDREPIEPKHFLKTSQTDKAGHFESKDSISIDNEEELLWQKASEFFGVELKALNWGGEHLRRRKTPPFIKKDELSIEVRQT